MATLRHKCYLCKIHLIEAQEVGDSHEIIQLLCIEFGYKLRKANLKTFISYCLEGKWYPHYSLYVHTDESYKLPQVDRDKEKGRYYIVTVCWIVLGINTFQPEDGQSLDVQRWEEKKKDCPVQRFVLSFDKACLIFVWIFCLKICSLIY